MIVFFDNRSKRKFPVTMLLRALGYSTNADIFRAFNCIETISLKSKDIFNYIGSTIVEDVIDENTGEIFIEGGLSSITLNRRT